ncbi:phospholipase A2 inhibitor and Ly6/PLAUR domain-containing protein-like [Rhineura floridana]|uniref:phospholipase A2 inhibitor and Ly6/PLAUR domain-containing protein-like n=1 Tax=Rhineura floridana TaxID=261503 RepID=UPI002AC86A2F|nr:phospholipase A2 inhibitor and Ly6/PLAUR domain-containing protein-like [Rhineura floridana]
MRTYLASCLFSILLTTGVCLQCEQCSSNTDSCTGMPHLCGPSDNACLTLTTEIVTGHDIWLATYKGCTKLMYCPPSPMSFTFPNQRKRRVAKCCRKNLCNSGAVTLPRLRTRPNGLKCPGCISKDPRCVPTEIIKCNGWEDNCVYYDVSVEDDRKIHTHAKRGCGTRRACLNKPHIFGIPGLYMEILENPQCTPAPKMFTEIGK